MSNRKKITRRDLLKRGTAGAAALMGSALVGSDIARAESPDSTKSPNKKNNAPLPQVPRRVLGKTKASIPILILGGTANLDPRFDPKVPEALRHGVNVVDLADCYGGGAAERMVGNFHVRAKVRNQLWLISKSDDHDPEGFENTLKQSLKRLQTDRIEMYYLHALKDPDYLNKDLARKVDALKQRGKMQHFGFSAHSDNALDLLNRAARLPWVDSVMFPYNFRRFGQKPLNRAMDACQKAGVGLLAMKTQGAELLSGAAEKRFRQAGKWNKHQAVLKAVWEDKRITAVVSRMDTLTQLKQNIDAALDENVLSQAEHQAISEYAQQTRALACDGCDHLCGAALPALPTATPSHVPVPRVPIADIMRCLMYHDTYGDEHNAIALLRRLHLRPDYLRRLDFASATRACPHGVDLTRHMARAAQLLGDAGDAGDTVDAVDAVDAVASDGSDTLDWTTT